MLEVSRLSFSWPSSTSAVLDIDSFSVAQGEKVFLHGPSGSGKSTLLNLIGGVLTPQRGEITFNGMNLNEMSSEARDLVRGDQMGFIFQMFNLLPYLNAVENITLPCEFSKRKAMRVLEQASSLGDEARRLLSALRLDPHILEEKSVTQLSVGQQQRVATARALIGRPEMVIADEPTSALDSNIRDRFLRLLFDECNRNGTSLVFVSHDLDLGKNFDRVVSLEEINRSFTADTNE
ncbi:MAG: methionine ABC transporter ATP-binding protein [Bdellovibrionaceae bacterium]|nr:methionine ABC transporter ATP-binding protein [Pseudobdellovibrionaceae bacterium]